MSLSLYEVLNRGRWVAAAAAAAALVAFGWACYELPARVRGRPTASAGLQRPLPIKPEAQNWAVFQSRDAHPAARSGPLAQRFRLAGTFFAYGESAVQPAEPARRAILDDLQTSRQHLLSEGDVLGDLQVAGIYHDRVILRVDGREEELHLSFAGGLGRKPPARPQAGAATQEVVPLEVNRFGKRVGESRWVFSRDSLMEYYQELLDDPERLASVYLSLKPDYQEGKIAGYVLDTEGEGEFFKAVGLHEGDVIRTVNSMRMTSQKRAEFFIGEFTRNRLNAVVIDLERNQKPAKLVYLIR